MPGPTSEYEILKYSPVVMIKLFFLGAPQSPTLLNTKTDEWCILEYVADVFN